MRFNQKTIWITGASSGIGEAMVYAFNREGANLIISSRNEKALSKVKANCNNDQHIKILPLDLSLTETFYGKVEEAIKCFGSIDILINNAGVAQNALAANTNEEVDRIIMEVNYFAPVFLAKKLLPHFLKEGKGHLVVVSSLSGKFGVPKLSSYSASKHALHGFFNSLRTEVHKHNIKITLIVPGYIKTAIARNALSGEGELSGHSLGVMEKGMDADKCAKEMVNAIYKKKEEAYIGNKEIISVYFYRLFPALFNKIIRNHPVKRLRKILKASI